MSDLVERLRAKHSSLVTQSFIMHEAADRIAELEARVKVLEDVADAAENVVKSIPMFPRHASARVLTRRLAALNPSARSE